MVDNDYYPAFLNLTNRTCLVVGGGMVATRKVEKLLGTGALVRVVSPMVGERLAELARAGDVVWVPRSYETGDIGDAWLVFSATDNRDVNRLVYEEAMQAHRFVNIADDASCCTFMVPSTVRKAGVQVAISTSGMSPAAAKQLRKALEADLASESRNFQDTLLQLSTAGLKRQKRDKFDV